MKKQILAVLALVMLAACVKADTVGVTEVQKATALTDDVSKFCDEGRVIYTLITSTGSAIAVVTRDHVSDKECPQ